MIFLKVAPVFFLILVARADKKIELQDIEEDNLKSEREKELEKSNQRSEGSGPNSAPGFVSLDFLKNGLLRYFDGPSQPPQPTRYVQQYAVTEPPERPPERSSAYTPKSQFSGPGAQQAMVGYLSNVPMQIYLVPQYYNEAEGGAGAHPRAQYTAPGVTRVAYQPAPEAAQNNYIEVPTYVAPTAKTYIPQYTSPPVAYVGYTAPAPAATAAPTVAPVVAYQVPVYQNPGPTQPPQKGYFTPHYTETNAVDEVHETAEETPKHYSHTEVSYEKAPANDYPRYYTSRPPGREEYRHSQITELPHPNPLLLKAAPPHLAHIPKALPVHRPLNRPVYGPSNHIPGTFPQRPSDLYGVSPFKRRPASLLDSYVPSHLQVEYMKRGFTSDPLVAYEALSSGHHPFSHGPRHYERGFLPNQMYHTAAGGVTFGHYKRTPKVDKVSQN